MGLGLPSGVSSCLRALQEEFLLWGRRAVRLYIASRAETQQQQPLSATEIVVVGCTSSYIFSEMLLHQPACTRDVTPVIYWPPSPSRRDSRRPNLLHYLLLCAPLASPVCKLNSNYRPECSTIDVCLHADNPAVSLKSRKHSRLTYRKWQIMNSLINSTFVFSSRYRRRQSFRGRGTLARAGSATVTSFLKLLRSGYLLLAAAVVQYLAHVWRHNWYTQPKLQHR